MPFILVIYAGQFHDRRAVKRGFFMRFNAFFISEIFPAELKLRTVCGIHPPVIKIDDVAVGTIVDDQWDNTAFASGKLLRKFQYISDGRTAETVQALVIVSDHADILPFTGEEKHELLLDIVRVLVFIDHDMRDRGAELVQNVLVIAEKPICLYLDGGEIHQIRFRKNCAIFLKHPTE